ncbi:MAG: hypothetical protein P8I94_06585 [Emcibacteraceae bacterium]|nr:hypothetical protein [Emcibacteraceae bacterium]
MNTINIQIQISEGNLIATLDAYSEFNTVSKEVTMPDGSTVIVQSVDYTGITPVATETVTISRPSENSTRSDDIDTLLNSTEWREAKARLSAE